MSRPVKELVTRHLRERYAGVDSACVVDLTGLNVKAQEQLRALLRQRSARLHVVKNSLARRAFQDTPLEPLGRALEGPCALVVSDQSLIEAAKALVAATREFEKLTLKQAIIEGDPNLLTVERLSRMKGRRELLGDLAALLTSPVRSLAGCLRAPQAKIAGCLKAMIDKAA